MQKIDDILPEIKHTQLRGLIEIQNLKIGALNLNFKFKDLEEYNMFIFIKVLVVFTKNAHVVCHQKF